MVADEIQRGHIWWAELNEPRRSEPEYRRPVLVVQANGFNRSRLHTVIVVVLTSNIRLAEAPGNVLLRAEFTGLPKDSVANVSQLLTLERDFFTEYVGTLSARFQNVVDKGMRLVLNLA